MPSPLAPFLSSRLSALSRAGRGRGLGEVSPQGQASGMVLRQGRPLLNLASNDYLGLARHPALIARAQAWAESHGAGATASRLVCGGFDLHRQVEEKLAAFKGGEAAVLVASGYQANGGVLAALLETETAGKTPLVLADRLIHASMYAGLRTAGVSPQRFRHNAPDHLDHLLTKHGPQAEGLRLVLVESVYSMDGDRAPLTALAEVAERHGAALYVDEAHATGVLGPQGRGLTATPELAGRVDVVMGTFGKALGGFGAYVAGSRLLIDYLVNRCGGLIYSTALPPSVLGAMDAALDLVPTLEAERARLHHHADHLRAVLHGCGVETLDSTTQIVPAVVGGEAEALKAAAALEERGVLAVAIRPPTVPPGTSRLRLALSAAHTTEQIDHAAQALREAFTR